MAVKPGLASGTPSFHHSPGPAPPQYSDGHTRSHLALRPTAVLPFSFTTVAVLPPGRVLGGWHTPGPQPGSCLQFSVAHIRDPMRTCIYFPSGSLLVTDRLGPRVPSCCLWRPWGLRKNRKLCVCSHQLRAGSVTWGHSLSF